MVPMKFVLVSEDRSRNKSNVRSFDEETFRFSTKCIRALNGRTDLWVGAKYHGITVSELVGFAVSYGNGNFGLVHFQVRKPQLRLIGCASGLECKFTDT